MPVSNGPLAGLRLLDLGGIGPGPFCGMVLGDLGADVIRVARPTEAGRGSEHPVLHRNSRSVAVDLKRPEGVDVALRLVDRADVVVEGFRPGVAERLGLGPDVCLARNARLVYGRMTGFGQDGPYANQPGHDITYIALAGALHAIGPAGGDPVPPLNLVGDFGGGGMLLAVGLLSAVLHARASGHGQVVDAAMVDGTALLLAMTYGALGSGGWQDVRGANLLDGGAPFYAVYRCADGRHVAIGALEPQFYAALLRVLGLAADPIFARQHDRSAWPAMRARLAEIFATRVRDEWARAFETQGACVAPVLSLTEAPAHPHHTARGTYQTDAAGLVSPAPAPRFDMTPPGTPTPAPTIGAHTREVFREAGLDAATIENLITSGVLAS